MRIYFFAYCFANEEYLWFHDFVWTQDVDHNDDRIYVGKYHDIDGKIRMDLAYIGILALGTVMELFRL